MMSKKVTVACIGSLFVPFSLFAATDSQQIDRDTIRIIYSGENLKDFEAIQKLTEWPSKCFEGSISTDDFGAPVVEKLCSIKIKTTNRYRVTPGSDVQLGDNGLLKVLDSSLVSSIRNSIQMDANSIEIIKKGTLSGSRTGSGASSAGSGPRSFTNIRFFTMVETFSEDSAIFCINETYEANRYTKLNGCYLHVPALEKSGERITNIEPECGFSYEEEIVSFPRPNSSRTERYYITDARYVSLAGFDAELGKDSLTYHLEFKGAEIWGRNYSEGSISCVSEMLDQSVYAGTRITCSNNTDRKIGRYTDGVLVFEACNYYKPSIN